jgi:hypothetical protein
MIKNRLTASIILVAVLTVGFLQPALAERAPGKVVLIAANRLSLDDLHTANLPNIDALVQGGSLGLIAASSAGRKTPESVLASVGAGAPARGSFALNDAYSAAEMIYAERATAAEVYTRRTGRSAAEGSVVMISIGRILRADADAVHSGRLGALGEALHEGGKRAAYFGNSDVGDFSRRSAAAIIIDRHGYIPVGDVSDGMLMEGMGPSGLVTDVDTMARAVSDTLPVADVIVLDFGDPARVDLSEPSLSPQAFAAYRKAAIENLDALVGRLIPMAKSGEMTLILASFSPPGGRDWSSLTPIVAFGADLQPGLLTSSTTRTPGLVTSIDIGPYILETVGVAAPDEMSGRTIRRVGDPDPTAALLRLAGVVVRNHRVQAPLFAPIAAVGMLALTAGVAFLAFGTRPSRSTFAAIRAVLVYSLSVPLSALLVSSIAPVNAFAYAATVLAVAAGVTAISLAVAFLLGRRFPDMRGRGALPMVVLAILIVFAALADAFAGGSLARFSSLASFGFRYYGLGNEYMALAVGSLCVAMIWLTAPVLSLRARRVCAGIFIVAAVAIGFPGFGTNAGGAATAVVTFGLLYLALSRGEFRLRHVAGLFGAAAVLLILFGAVDIIANETGASHIGETIAATQREGPGYLVAAATRKMTLNFQHLGLQQGKLAVMGSTPFLVLWFVGVHPRLMERVRKGPEGSGVRLLAVVAGAGTALISNDNGIIAASLLLSPMVVAIFLSMMEDGYGQNNGP